MSIKSFEFKIEGYTLTVDHKQPEDFSQYKRGTWTYSLVMDASNTDELNNQCLSVDSLCYDIQGHLLRCKYRPDPFMLFLGIERVRSTLSLSLDSDLFKKGLEELDNPILNPFPIVPFY
jgi:hypothetical protein